MATTIITSPDTVASAYREIIWETTSDREAGNIGTVTGIVNNGGFAQFNVVAGHGILVGDVVEPSINTLPIYSVKQTVTAVTATSITTDFVYSGSATPGTVTRINSNMQVNGRIFKMNTTVLTITGAGINGDNTVFTTSTAHGLKVGEVVRITGTTSYNGNHIVVVVSSATIFQVVFVYVASETGDVVTGKFIGETSRKSIFDGVNIAYRFNFANYLQTELSSNNFGIGATGFQTDHDESLFEYVVVFVEQFDDVDGYLQDQESTFGTFKYATQITLQHQQTQNVTRFLQDTGSKQWLTNMPDLQKIRRDEHLQLAFITDMAGVRNRIRQYDSAGSTIANTISGSFTINNKRGILRVDVSGLMATCVKFDVRLLSTSDADRSELVTMTIDDRCVDDAKRIWWLNRDGGFDAYTFTGDVVEGVQSKQTTFQRLIQTGFAVSERGITTLGVDAMTIFEVFSSFVTDDQASWLSEIYTSPEVILQVGSNMIPIKVTATKQRTINGDALVQMSLKYVEANQLIIQGG